MLIYNAHAHLDILNSSYPYAIVPSVDETNWDIVRQYKLFGLGIHPWYVKTNNTDILEQLKEKIHTYSPIAIGECGLDYHISVNPKIQQYVFEYQLELATEYELPVIIHAVKSIDIIIKTLKKYPVTAQMHGFKGSYQQGQALIEEGHYLSFGGYKKSQGLMQLIREMPISALLIETDEKPLDTLILVAKEIATLRQISVAKLVEHTNANCKTLFNIV